MKKAILLALAFILVSLAACKASVPAPPSDVPLAKEFAITNGTCEVWTPFPGQTGVTFQVSDEAVLSLADDGTELTFTGRQVGECEVFAHSGDSWLKITVMVVSDSVKMPQD